MINVRVFGVMRLLLKVSNIKIPEAKGVNTVGAVLKIIDASFDNITLKELKGCIVFVNGTNIVELKRLRTEIDTGDEIQIFSTMGGG
jgi:molybdopterin converting factor small subunit